MRRKYWGYAKEENLSVDRLVGEEYAGVRPAGGYPACPDHTEKGLLWELLEVEKLTGMRLTESYAMNPPASVSGLYFAHPESRYFNGGPVGRDQVEDYANRKAMALGVVEKWLSPNLDYDQGVERGGGVPPPPLHAECFLNGLSFGQSNLSPLSWMQCTGHIDIMRCASPLSCEVTGWCQT